MAQSILNLLYPPELKSDDDSDFLYDNMYEEDSFRKEIEQEINEVTSICLAEGFSYSDSPDTIIHNSPHWQIKLKNLVANRNFLKYPYVLTTSDEDPFEHIEVKSPEEFLQIYLEFFTFETIAANQGTQIKNQLLYLSDDELDEFVDERITFRDDGEI